MGHGLQDCDVVPDSVKNSTDDELPFSVALKAEPNMLGRESLKLGVFTRKTMKQYVYVGEEASKVKTKILTGKGSRKSSFLEKDDEQNKVSGTVIAEVVSNSNATLDSNWSSDLINIPAPTNSGMLLMDHNGTFDAIEPSLNSGTILDGCLVNRPSPPQHTASRWRRLPRSLIGENSMLTIKFKKRKAEENLDLRLEVFMGEQNLKKNKGDGKGSNELVNESETELALFSPSKLRSTATNRYADRTQ